jgi:poly(3-hydroxybutyrate) depolymerase
MEPWLKLGPYRNQTHWTVGAGAQRNTDSGLRGEEEASPYGEGPVAGNVPQGSSLHCPRPISIMDGCADPDLTVPDCGWCLRRLGDLRVGTRREDPKAPQEKGEWRAAI